MFSISRLVAAPAILLLLTACEPQFQPKHVKCYSGGVVIADHMAKHVTQSQHGTCGRDIDGNRFDYRADCVVTP